MLILLTRARKSWNCHIFLSYFLIPSIFCYREEIDTPRVWAQICIQRMAELAKESTTMRHVLDPMLVYFDSGHHWVPRQGLAMIVLSDMSYLLESAGILIFNHMFLA